MEHKTKAVEVSFLKKNQVDGHHHANADLSGRRTGRQVLERLARHYGRKLLPRHTPIHATGGTVLRAHGIGCRPSRLG